MIVKDQYHLNYYLVCKQTKEELILGDGIVNLQVYSNGHMERIGDYTHIQRKYNTNRAWLIASYPFGSSYNNFYVTNGLNNWISEFYLYPENTTNNYSIYPNPNDGNTLSISLKNRNIDKNKQLIIRDLSGNIVCKKTIDQINKNVKIDNLKNGIYFVTLISKTKQYETKKLIINH